MSQELKDIQLQTGAIFPEGETTPSSFGNEKEAFSAVKAGVALHHSPCDIIKVSGADRLRFLHNQTTNDFNRLQPGEGCETVFVTSTARTIDLVTALVTEAAVLLLVSPQRCQQLLELMDRYIFPMDKVELEDITPDNVVFTLIGPKSNDILQQLDVTAIIGQPAASNTEVKLNDIPVRVALGSGLAMPGFKLLVSQEKSAAIWKELTQKGVIPIGDRLVEKLRIEQGKPTPDKELTEDYNPLEAGLWQTLSFDKGCYIGQETIARLNTYKGVKQRLWGIKLSLPVEVGTPITVEGSKVGIITSCTETDTGAFGLGYIKTKAGGVGLKVTVGEASAEVVAVPYLKHEYYQ